MENMRTFPYNKSKFEWKLIFNFLYPTLLKLQFVCRLLAKFQIFIYKRFRDILITINGSMTTDVQTYSSPPNCLWDHCSMQVIHILNFKTLDLTALKISRYQEFFGMDVKTNRLTDQKQIQFILKVTIVPNFKFQSHTFLKISC